MITLIYHRICTYLSTIVQLLLWKRHFHSTTTCILFRNCCYDLRDFFFYQIYLIRHNESLRNTKRTSYRHQYFMITCFMIFNKSSYHSLFSLWKYSVLEIMSNKMNQYWHHPFLRRRKQNNYYAIIYSKLILCYPLWI